MDSDARNKLLEARRLMIKVRDELNNIAAQTRNAAENVGEQRCARSLEKLAGEYNEAIKHINKVV